MEYKREVSYSYAPPDNGSAAWTRRYKTGHYILMVLHGLFDYD